MIQGVAFEWFEAIVAHLELNSHSILAGWSLACSFVYYMRVRKALELERALLMGGRWRERSGLDFGGSTEGRWLFVLSYVCVVVESTLVRF